MAIDFFRCAFLRLRAALRACVFKRRKEGSTAAVVGTALAAAPAAAQTAMPGQFKGIKALAFDARPPRARSRGADPV
jgi:hypothetical protein